MVLHKVMPFLLFGRGTRSSGGGGGRWQRAPGHSEGEGGVRGGRGEGREGGVTGGREGGLS